MTSTKSQIRKITDLQSFLNAHASDMKEKNPRWSIGVWHSKLGLGSRTTLVKILNAQRVPGKKMIQAFVEYFGFKEEEADHFRALVQLKKNSGDKKVREAILSQINAGTDAVPTQTFERSTQALLTNWYHLPLLAMIHSKSFGQDPKVLAKRFSDSVTETQIEEAIRLFVESGLVTVEKQGRLKIAKNWQMLRPIQLVAQSLEIEKLRTALFEAQLELTKQKLPKLSNGNSALRTICVAIKRSNLPYANELIRQFTEKFSELTFDDEGADIYQLQLQFIPMTN